MEALRSHGGVEEAPVERKAMDSKQPCAKFSSNILNRSFDDDHSVASAKSGKPLLDQLFVTLVTEVSLISREPNLRFERISISRGFL